MSLDHQELGHDEDRAAQTPPYLTQAMREELERTLLSQRYQTKLAALLPTLHMLQHEYGWIPHQAMLEAANFLQLAPRRS